MKSIIVEIRTVQREDAQQAPETLTDKSLGQTQEADVQHKLMEILN